MPERREASKKAYDLIWKVAYHAFDADRDLRAEYESLPTIEKARLYDRCRNACMKYAIAYVRDEEFAGASEDFGKSISIFVTKIGVPLRKWKRAIFANGAPRAAGKVYYCLLRAEGFVLRRANQQEFISRIVAAFRETADQPLANIRQRLEDEMDPWEFTGDPDPEAFRAVFEYRELQGNQLAAVFVQ